MPQQLDGPSKQDVLTVDNSTVQTAQAIGGPLDERKVVTLQPLGGRLRVYFGDDSGTPPTSTVALSDGVLVFRNQLISFEASQTQTLYIISESNTQDVIIIERA